MTHFAKVKDGIVTNVIAAEQEYIDTIEGTWVETSYDGSIRKQYAGIGYTYDSAKDIFIRKQPYPTHILDENNDWQPPIPYPNPDTSVNGYFWNEDAYQADNTAGWIDVY